MGMTRQPGQGPRRGRAAAVRVVVALLAGYGAFALEGALAAHLRGQRLSDAQAMAAGHVVDCTPANLGQDQDYTRYVCDSGQFLDVLPNPGSGQDQAAALKAHGETIVAAGNNWVVHFFGATPANLAGTASSAGSTVLPPCCKH